LKDIKNLSKELIKLNDRRKKIETLIINEIDFDKIKKEDNSVIIYYNSNINEGLIGIIAARLKDFFNKPSIVITNSNNILKGSARSISNYNIGRTVKNAVSKNILINGGGHNNAAGFTLKKDKLIEFKKLLNTIYKNKFSNAENVKYFTSEQSLKSLFSFAKKELQSLEPLGNNNMNPFFLLKKNKIIKYKVIKNFHIQIVVKNKYNRSCLCFAFNAIDTRLGDILMNVKKEIDLIVQINNNIIHKNSDFNLIIKDAIV